VARSLALRVLTCSAASRTPTLEWASSSFANLTAVNTNLTSPVSQMNREHGQTEAAKNQGESNMKRLLVLAASFVTVVVSATAFASDAETSASAGSSRSQRNGTASATARYEGDRGFARTDTRSGVVNIGRGVAVGVDEDGLSLSVSGAFAPQNGPAVATTFNLSIGRDGRISGSTGLAVSDGPFSRAASAGGWAGTERGGAGAVSQASGRTDPFGRVVATTRAEDSRPRYAPVVDEHRDTRVVRVVRTAGPWRR
jgi:hypothetical protein